MKRLRQTYPRTSDNVLAFGITLRGKNNTMSN